MDEQLLDIYAHLNLHEALLAINLANIFREIPNGRAQFEQFRSDLLDRLTVRAFPPPASASTGGALFDHSVEVARTFFQKVEQRMAD